MPIQTALSGPRAVRLRKCSATSRNKSFHFAGACACFLILAAEVLSCGCGLDKDLLGTKSEKTKAPSAVLFNIDGPMPQFESPQMMFQSDVTSQYKLENLLAKAAGDIYVQEIAIHFGTMDFSFARAQEIVGAIKRAAARGKPIVCHIDDADNLTYWTAAQACSRILLSPAGSVDIRGLSLEAVYMREMLASIGVTADVLAVGKYKDAAESLTRDGMSPEAREASTSLLNELHRSFLQGIMNGRKIDEAAAQVLVDNSPYDSEEAIELGLADGISTLTALRDSMRDKYAGGVIDDYGKGPAKPFTLTEFVKLLSGEEKKTTGASVPKIALVSVVGPIVGGEGGELFSGMEAAAENELTATLSDLRRDNTVHAVVLRIDSPGGSALASDNIWHSVRALVAAKPVIASLGDVAASGGYYIASAANEIFAAPSTITGSIGVIGGKVVVQEAASKLGIRTERIDTGKRSGIFSPFALFDEDGRRAVGRLMQKMYDIFVDRVVEGRRMDRNSVLRVAEGRVWSGTQALELKLVDSAGGLYEAIERARSVARLSAGAPVEIFPKSKSFIEMIGETLSNPDMGAVKALAARHQSLKNGLMLTGLLTDNRVLAFMPIVFEIR